NSAYFQVGQTFSRRFVGLKTRFQPGSKLKSDIFRRSIGSWRRRRGSRKARRFPRLFGFLCMSFIDSWSCPVTSQRANRTNLRKQANPPSIGLTTANQVEKSPPCLATVTKVFISRLSCYSATPLPALGPGQRIAAASGVWVRKEFLAHVAA